MKSKSSGLARSAKIVVGLALLTISSGLTGCGRLKSACDSLLHRHHAAKATPLSPHHPHPAVPTGPKLAIILDDLAGDDSSATVGAIFALHYPLTLSVLPNHSRSAEIASEAHRRGYQVMLHLPMEAVANEIPEAQELRPGMSTSEISGELKGMLDSVPYAAGVNNHQGSLATSDARLMNELMPLLRDRNLFFIDSRTTAASVAFGAARSDGVRTASRNVPFLDDVRDESAIRRQLSLAFKGAKERGEAIAIGHPHPETLRALTEMLPEAQAEGVHLVLVSELVH